MVVGKHVFVFILSVSILLEVASQEFASVDDIWTVTDEYGGGWFEGEITIPIKSSINSWQVSVEFDKPVTNFQVSEAELEEDSEHKTLYLIKNVIWNGNLQNGDEIYFRVQGFVDGNVLPKLTVKFQDKIYRTIPPKKRPKPISNFELREIINSYVDYEEAIKLSMKFFEAQKSGYTAKNNEIKWKGRSGLYDGGVEGVNLVGGYYIGGGYVKHNYPMAFAVTQLVWGALEFSEGYESAGQMENLFKTVKWATDYFMKCHSSQNEYYGMVGDPDVEVELWESSQNMDWKRPAYKITTNRPGSDLAGETAAALAAASVLFETAAPDYSRKLIKHARELWEFGERNRGRYDFTAIPKASPYYGSTDYNDELIWGAIWLYQATEDQIYLKYVENMYGRLTLDSPHGLSYDDKLLGIQLLMADITSDHRTYMSPVKEFCNSPGGDDAYILQNGLIYKDTPRGPIEFAANAAFVCAMVAKRSLGSPEEKKYLSFVRSQIHVMLGTGKRKGFMVGFGDNHPENLHHRDSSCPTPPASCGWDFYDDTSIPNTYQLEGALVGGPDGYGEYNDSRQNYDLNEPNILFNSALQSALAGLIFLSSEDADMSGAGSGFFIGSEFSSPSKNLRHLFTQNGAETLFDACFSNPCQNGASCNNTENMEFSCECAGSFYGELCDQKLSPAFEWMTTWPNGGHVHVHLPGFMYEGKKKLTLAFPIDCPIVSVEVWQACLVPSQSDILNGLVVIQQIGWQTENKFLGMKYEFSGEYSFKNCFETSEFGFKISDQEANNQTCVKAIPEIEETEEEPEPPTLEIIPPMKDGRELGRPDTSGDDNDLPILITDKTVPLDGQLEPDLTGDDDLPIFIAEKRVPMEGDSSATDLAMVQADKGMITWVSRWRSGAQGNINLKQIQGSGSKNWVLRFLFPAQCPLGKVEFWHTCIVPELSDPGRGLFTFKQIGWQLYQGVIGMNLEFKDPSPSFDCFDVSQYYFISEESDAGKRLFPSSCKVKFHQADMISDGNPDPLPFVVVGSDGEPLEEEDLEDPETSKSDEPLKRSKPTSVRNIWLRGISSGPPPNQVSVSGLRVKRVASSAVQISWKRPKNKTKKVQVQYNTRDQSEEDDEENQGEDEEEEEEEEDGKPKIAKLKHAGSKKRKRMPMRTKELPRRKNRMLVKNLLPGKSYEFVVRTWDGRTYGPENTVSVTLDPVDIGKMRTTNPNDTSLHFQWKKPRGYRKVYDVAYFPDSPGGHPKTPFKISGDETEVTVVGLEKTTEYVFVFTVQNEEIRSGGKYVFVTTGSDLCGETKCPDSAQCSQTELGPDCTCDIGFVERKVLSLSRGKYTTKCEDINECRKKKAVCDENAKCTNTAGSYQCKCKGGYEGDGYTCSDVDECSLPGLDLCPGATCKNIMGSYHCQCQEGYIHKKTLCIDENECETGKSRCPEGSRCLNRLGTYTCLCPKGTAYFESQCQDIDECYLKWDNCRKTEICLNTWKSYSCVCGKGRRKTVLGCTDINECREKTHKCSQHAACRNTMGGYKCFCKRGYVGNGYICKDSNECAKKNVCDKNAGICTNLRGSYTCSCKEGFTGDGRKCIPLL